MKTNLLKQGIVSENTSGIGMVTRGMVRQRAIELAVINGHEADAISKSDWEQAKRELTGEENADIDPNEEILDAAPESERWNPLPGSIGHQVQESSSEDEEGEGRSNSARLVEQGIGEAEHNQMLQAAKAQRKQDEG